MTATLSGAGPVQVGPDVGLAPLAAPAPGYRVERFRDWETASADWARAGGTLSGTAFQDPRWLGAWYAAHRGRPGLEPLVLSAHDSAGRPALLLPLVVRRAGRVLRVAEFADLGLTDYNLPVLGPAAPGDRPGAARLWRALRWRLPADLVRLRKMPPGSGGRPNPLALLRGAAPCVLNGNAIHLGDSFEAYMRGTIARPVRMELERSWRVFQRREGTRFRRITDPAEGLRVLDAMDRQQRRRMAEIGNAFDLDRPEAAGLYRGLVGAHLADGYAVMTALTAGDEVVAAMLGIMDARGLVVIRLSNEGGKAWANCSPGRLLLERTLAHLHAEGCRWVDFSIGNYEYKRRFGVEATPLVDLVRALTPLGLPGLARARGAAALRRHPGLDARARHWLGLAAPGGGG